MADVLKVIGLMSGTSLDGIDAAILDTDGEAVAVRGPALTVPYDTGTHAMLRAALEAALHTPPGGPVPADIAKAERLLTDAHGAAVLALLENAALKPGDIALIGFHGQTVLHRPSDRRTWQIGDGEALARATGIPVVNEFRKADVAAGGQGAPFVPLYHLVLTGKMGRPIAVVNIGGVANLTYVGAAGELIAFDTGPGNAALDDWALSHTGKPLDSEGKLAASGRVNETVLASMLHHPMFLQPPPKSLDRFDFPMTAVEGLSGPDGAATLTAFTAAAIARANEHLPRAAETLDHLRRRAPQSRADARAARAAYRRGHPRRRCGVAGRFPGGGGFRLSRGAQHQRPAPQPTLDHRRSLSHAGRPASFAASALERQGVTP